MSSLEINNIKSSLDQISQNTGSLNSDEQQKKDSKNRASPAEIEVNFYYDQMKPFLIMFILLARQPYQINKEGEFVLHLTSVRTIYCVFSFAIQCVLCANTYREVLKKLYHVEFNERSGIQQSTTYYDNLLYTAVLLNLLHLNLSTPFLHWTVTRGYLKLLNDFTKFQEMYEDTTGQKIQVKFKKIILFTAITAIFAALNIDFIETYYIIAGYDFVAVSPYIILSFDLLYFTLFWGFTLIIIGNLAEEISKKLSQDLQIKSSAMTIYKYKKLWLNLTLLLNEFCSVSTLKFFAFFLVMILYFLISTYGLALTIAEERYSNVMGFFLTFMFASVTLLIFCDTGHRVSQKAGIQFAMRIYKCNFQTLSDDERLEELPKEVKTYNYESRQWFLYWTFKLYIISYFFISLKSLLNIIKVKPPTVTILSYFEINRRLYKNILSGIVTYIIILVQFKISSIASKQN